MTNMDELKKEFDEFGKKFCFDWTGDSDTLWQWIEQKLAEQREKGIEIGLGQKLAVNDNKTIVKIKVDRDYRELKAGFYDEGILREKLGIDNSRDIYCQGSDDYLLEKGMIIRINRNTKLFTSPKVIT